MILLELFGGIDTGLLALTQLGINVDKCYTSEIKEIAIKCSKDNWGDKVIQIGDVTKVSYKDGILYTENGNFDVPKIDLLTSGSPCQDFSQANKNRKGLEGEKSSLFFEVVRLIKETQPTYFFQENVEMDMVANNFISEVLGVNPVNINSYLVSPQMRNRWYWTNIPGLEQDLFGKIIGQPKDRNIKFQDILEIGYTDREKSRCVMEADCRPKKKPIKMYHRYVTTGFTTLIFKSKGHYLACKKHFDRNFNPTQEDVKNKITSIDKINNFKGDLSVYDGVRYLNQNELEICQTFPKGYTKCLTRNEAASVLGDGWTLEIIKHIFKGLIEIFGGKK